RHGPDGQIGGGEEGGAVAEDGAFDPDEIHGTGASGNSGRAELDPESAKQLPVTDGKSSFNGASTRCGTQLRCTFPRLQCASPSPPHSRTAGAAPPSRRRC